MVTKVRLSCNVLPGSKDKFEVEAKVKKMNLGQYFDFLMARGQPISEGEKPTGEGPEKVTVIAEELELPNSLLKITRDTDGQPVGWVRPRTTRPDGSEEPWVEVDHKKLRELNVEIQGLTRDRLARDVQKRDEEIKTMRARRTAFIHRMPVGARTELAIEDDTAKPDKFWCRKCRVTVETPEEIAAHRKLCGEEWLEPFYG